jgi:hypothetical protein
MFKKSIQQEGTMIINLYAPNAEAPSFIKETLLDVNGERGCTKQWEISTSCIHQ